MGFKGLVMVTLISLSSLQSWGAPLTLQVFKSKQITQYVDRFYGKDGNAFATVFCKGEAKEAMLVDGRLGDLDGRNFYFNSVAECNQGRLQAREMANECVINLVVDTTTEGAAVTVKCK